VLSLVIGFLATIAGGACRPVRADRFRRLDASVEASGPHDFAVRISTARPAVPTRPPHPAPRVVTIASRPSFLERDNDNKPLICVRGKAENFSREGWTGFC
jgi:hypothetical protein